MAKLLISADFPFIQFGSISLLVNVKAAILMTSSLFLFITSEVQQLKVPHYETMKFLGQQKCTTCRQRKLKCDNHRPVCGPCAKSSRRCTFAPSSVFRHYDTSSSSSEKARFTRRVRPNNRDASGRMEPLSLRVPQQLTFVYTNDISDNPLRETSNLTLGMSMNQVDTVRTPNIIACYPSVEIDFRISSSPHAPEAVGTSTFVHTPNGARLDPSNLAILQVRLLEHFKRVPGRWMDLFDDNSFFTGQIPLLAAASTVIRNAACALAAKHISQLHHPRAGVTGRLSSDTWLHRSLLDTGDGSLRYETVQLYDAAVKQTKKALSREASDVSFGSEILSSEDVLAVVAMLSLYELMDAPGVEWRAHLGALPLLDESSITTPGAPIHTMKALVRKSLFWTFARQDVMSAFVHETQTFLDLDDAELWRRFGLRTEDFGIHIPCNEEPSHFSPPLVHLNEAPLMEAVMSNAMIWLLGRIINFTTSGDSIDPKEYALPVGFRPIIAVPQEALLELWKQLERQLKRWHDSLPPTFKPVTRTQAEESGDCGFEKIYYNVPMCAATMQSYHMACTLLLVNRPQESTAIRSTVTSRMKSYKEIQRRALEHSREICGISLAEPPDSVRVNSLQPLFVAGQCFDDPTDREIVTSLLFNVEKELGWKSGYYVDKLRAQWAQVD